MDCTSTFDGIATSMHPFGIYPLSDELRTQMINTGIWKPDCPVEIDRLRLVKFIHYDFSNVEQQGQIVVLEAVAKKVMAIFETLYKCKFPIQQAKTMEGYLGNDKPSMVDNNTSAFNFRPIAGKKLLSVHSYGVAIDVNPIQNPCLDQREVTDKEEVMISVQPAAGQEYLNRTNVRAGMVEQVLDNATGMRVVELFQKNGFYVWGGKWNVPVDWQHFQPSRAAAEWLAFMTPKDATNFFELYIESPALLNNPLVRDFDFKTLYEKNPHSFMQALQTTNVLTMDPQEAYQALSIFIAT